MSAKGIGQLGRLTGGERLLLDRRRRGELQSVAAARRGVTRIVYGNMERDRLPVKKPPVITGLKPHERCLLYRRRVGHTQREVAMNMGLCTWWVNLMERGRQNCDKLLWYWEQ